MAQLIHNSHLMLPQGMFVIHKLQKTQKLSLALERPGPDRVHIIALKSLAFCLTFFDLIGAKSLQLHPTVRDSMDWTVNRQAPLSMGFSRQEYWSGLPFLSPRDLPDPGIEPASLMSLALVGQFFTAVATWETSFDLSCVYKQWVVFSASQRKHCWQFVNTALPCADCSVYCKVFTISSCLPTECQ